jgi:hypothetical protein
MARKANASGGVSLKITISRQSASLLTDIALRGIYGRNPSDVASRFVDEALQKFVEVPKLTIKLPQPGKVE